MSDRHKLVNPEEWERKKNKVMELQDAIECQDRIVEATENRIQEVNQLVENRTKELEVEKNNFLSQNTELANDIGRLNTRVVNLVSRQNAIQRSNAEIQQTINQLLNEKSRLAKSGTDWYREAKAQFFLMEHDADFNKFASSDLLALKAQINQGAAINWTDVAMQAQAQILLSDVYLLSLKVNESRRSYEAVQKQCVELATTILEQAQMIRKEAELDGYKVGEDIDFWTGNALEDIERETCKALETITLRRNDPNFQESELRDLLGRLKELKDKKDDVIKCAMENVGHSEKVQAEVNFAGDILVQQHGFECIGADYEMKDERRPFIGRYCRKQDGMEVEFISAYDQASGTYIFIHRMNSATYADPNIMATLQQGIINSLAATGRIRGITQGTCAPENQLEAFDLGNPRINVQTRTAHGISNDGLTYVANN